MKNLQLRLVILASLCLFISALFLSFLALRHFENELPPEMARTVTAASYSTTQVLQKALDFDVPFTELVGVDEFLGLIRKDNPDIAYLAITDMAGNTLYQNGLHELPDKITLEKLFGSNNTRQTTARLQNYFDTHIPLQLHGQRVGSLHLGQKARLIEQKLQDVGYDVITVLVVASLIAIELLRFVLTYAISAPLDVTNQLLARIKSGDFTHYLPHEKVAGISQLSAHLNRIIAQLNERFHALQNSGEQARAALQPLLARTQFHSPGERSTLYCAAIDYIRWPFFLLIFADSLSLSFFPVYVGQFYSDSMGISKNMVIGLPISIFMFTWALSMPWAGMWSDRVGYRKAFVVGAILTTSGLLLTACANTLLTLLVSRCLTALGYGLAFLTAQSYVSAHTPANQRTKGMAIFLSTFFAGSLSGSAIGGILADRVGYAPTIFLSALLSAIAALFVLRFLRNSPQTTTQAPKKKLSMRDFKLLLRNPKFVTISFLAAIPAKIALTGFLYYSVPLYLKILGNNQSTTGRVMMAYGLAIIILSPLIAKLADRIGRLRWFVSVGGFGAALAMFIIAYFDNTFALLLSISILGIAHAIGVSPQLALINDFCQDVVQEVGNGTATGIFRLVERVGNVLGPIIAALLIAQFGFKGAFIGIGTLCLVCISCFTLVFFGFEHAAARRAKCAV